jgi:hypothetical protein
MKKQIVRIIITLLVVIFLFPTVVEGQNPVISKLATDEVPRFSIDSGTLYLRAWTSPSQILTFVSSDGTVSVSSIWGNSVYVTEYSPELSFVRNVGFGKELAKFGGFAKDNEGNFYLFFGEEVAENEPEKINMILAKYDKTGTKQGTYSLKANAPNSFNGIKKPFEAGSCRVEVSGNLICVYFGREMFESKNDGLNHQASYGFILDKNALTRIDTGQATHSLRADIGRTLLPYVSHSFNQFILPITNGFAFVDHGDMYPRALRFSKFTNGQNTIGMDSFTFKGGQNSAVHYNTTFAQLGGIAKTQTGYIFAGTYEKNNIVQSNQNDSRNLFILTVDEALTKISQPKWMTSYTDKTTENAGNPKIVALNAGRYLLMWEQMTNRAYKTTLMKIVDDNGNPLTAEKELSDTRLNYDDVLRYNPVTGNVHWAVSKDNKFIYVYSLNPDKEININE